MNTSVYNMAVLAKNEEEEKEEVRCGGGGGSEGEGKNERLKLTHSKPSSRGLIKESEAIEVAICKLLSL